MHTLKTALQSFSSWTNERVEKQAYEAARKGDIEALSYCLAELSPKHRNIDLTAWLNITEFAQKRKLHPVDWLEKAVETTHRFTPKTTGKHNLYIILLSGLHGKTPGYGLYIGETSKSPEARFREHTQGTRNRKGPLFSRIVYKYHKCLLPTLYSHLNPLSRKEAKELEGEIAEALRLEGIHVYGGH
ncbi:MAG TPA: hypothetical protein G4O16_00285 [Dehalococcoidia bacterium]|nr:hypothetical protein [Dehalococcoidia bacterium]